MKSNRINTPIGTKDKLFDESRAVRKVIRKIEDVFEKKGYSEVITPTFEYLDVYKTPKNPLPEELLYKFVENSGRLLVLRPDMTTPIARIAATKIMDEAFPVRLCYVDDVYRMSTLGTTQFSQIKQAGIELIGAFGVDADVEVISVAADALCEAGLTGFKIEIGHAGLYKEMIGRLNLDELETEKIRALIENKNFAGLKYCIEKYDDASDIMALCSMFGDVSILDEAMTYAKSEQTKADISYLMELYSALKKKGLKKYISFDLSMVAKIDYYTGIIIQAFASGVGKTVLSGGRYDTLISDFGKDLPAVGFAIDVLAVVGGSDE